MPLLACKSSTHDVLAEALLAAELNEAYATARLPSEALRELFASMPELRVSVPYAALRLLARLAGDGRVDVRTQAARALGWFADAYPERVEQLLVGLACDAGGKVRGAAAEALAQLLPAVNDPWRLIAAWDAHPDRAREVLAAARRSLPAPLGV